jgi:Uma2 family endonuclease
VHLRLNIASASSIEIVAQAGAYTLGMVNAEEFLHRLLTVDEYLTFENASSVRHEYVGGYVYAYAGASRRHNRIIVNIAGHLINAVGSGPCEVHVETVKLRPANDVFYYPDIMVLCDENDDESLYATRPTLVVEVLSPSTEAVDRRDKLLAYRSISSMEAYVIVYQDERRVIRHWKDDDGAWRTEEFIDNGRIPFPGTNVELTLSEIYGRITF